MHKHAKLTHAQTRKTHMYKQTNKQTKRTIFLLSRLDNVVALEGVSCEPGEYTILSHSSRLVKVWYIMQLYSQSANIGARCTHLQATSHPLVPLRVVATCADSAVRVVSPVTAQVITTALLPPARKITSVALTPYQGNKDSIALTPYQALSVALTLYQTL